MGYIEALEAAGAKVIVSEYFGSYQGEWLALVEYNGEKFWVIDCFGSCSHCDAYQMWEEEHFPYSEERNPEEFNEALAEFGKSYLSDPYTQEEAEEYVSKNLEWDLDAQEMVDFVKNNRIQ